MHNFKEMLIYLNEIKSLVPTRDLIIAIGGNIEEIKKKKSAPDNLVADDYREEIRRLVEYCPVLDRSLLVLASEIREWNPNSAFANTVHKVIPERQINSRPSPNIPIASNPPSHADKVELIQELKTKLENYAATVADWETLIDLVKTPYFFAAATNLIARFYEQYPDEGVANINEFMFMFDIENANFDDGSKKFIESTLDSLLLSSKSPAVNLGLEIIIYHLDKEEESLAYYLKKLNTALENTHFPKDIKERIKKALDDRFPEEASDETLPEASLNDTSLVNKTLIDQLRGAVSKRQKLNTSPNQAQPSFEKHDETFNNQSSCSAASYQSQPSPLQQEKELPIAALVTNQWNAQPTARDKNATYTSMHENKNLEFKEGVQSVFQALGVTMQEMLTQLRSYNHVNLDFAKKYIEQCYKNKNDKPHNIFSHLNDDKKCLDLYIRLAGLSSQGYLPDMLMQFAKISGKGICFWEKNKENVLTLQESSQPGTNTNPLETHIHFLVEENKLYALMMQPTYQNRNEPR